MRGYTDTGLPLEPSPSMRQGFGRAALLTSLPLQNNSRTPPSMHVVNGRDIAAGERVEYCVHGVDEGVHEFRATLAWHDYPSLLTASSDSQLVNDLDLSLRQQVRTTLVTSGNA